MTPEIAWSHRSVKSWWFVLGCWQRGSEAGDLRQLNLYRDVRIIINGNETCIMFLLNGSSEQSS